LEVLVRICSVDGCQNVHKGRGFCQKHYARLKKHGDPLHIYVHWNKDKKHSKSTKQKMSKSKIGKHTGKDNPFYGRKHTEASKKIIGKHSKSRIKSPETRLKKSISMRGSKNHFYGRKHTEASKRIIGKMEEGNTYALGLKRSEETKKLIRERRLHQVFPKQDTKLELRLQEIIIKLKIKFKKHMPIMGQPDIFIEPNICIFTDGDYWHGWFYMKGKDYSNYKVLNNEYFKKKILRDEKITNELKKSGFIVLRFWEHEIHDEPKKVIKKIQKFVNLNS